MSTADGEINIQVQAEGTEDAAQQLAEGDGGGGPPGGGQQGALSGRLTKGGIIGFIVGALLGPIIDMLQPILDVLHAFLAPVAIMLLRVFQPVLRALLTKVLPAWLNFMSFMNQTVSEWGPILTTIAGAFPMLLIPLLALEALGVDVESHLANLWQDVSTLASDIWSAIAGGASWLTNGAAYIGTAVWKNISGWATGVREDLASLPERIWSYVKALPGKLATAISRKVPGLGGGGSGFLSGVNIPGTGGGSSGNGLSLSDLRDALSGNDGGGDTAIQISGGLGAFVDSVEKNSGVDLF